jgi:NACHT domain
MEEAAANIVSKVSVNVLTELFEMTLGSFRHADVWLKGKNKKYDPLGLAAKKYAQKMEDRYDSMRIFGMPQPVPLRNIYTRVNVLKKITASHRIDILDLQRFFDFDRRGFGFNQDTRDGLQAVNEIHKIIVLGKPGAGKTTFLKHVALQALDGKLSEGRIPIFVSLKNWSDTNESSDGPISLMAYIVREFDICNFPDALQYVERMLHLGKCLVILDGFDEVSANVEQVIRQINQFADKYEKNQFILSCRIAAYNYCFERFTDLEIADFSDAQIKIFIDNWFGKDSPKAKLAWSAVDESRPIRELAATPLLLTILCLAFDETMGFPPNKGDLYKEGIDALLKKWDSSRAIKRDEIYRDLSLKRKESMLARIAAMNFQSGQYFLRQDSLERQIGEYIENLQKHRDSFEPEVDGNTILKAIEAQHGLFVERAKGIFSFSHLTFQEYFTAKYIIDNATRGALGRLVNKYLTSERWREVFLLVAELLEDADVYFILMADKIKTIEVREEIKQCVTAILQSASGMSKAGRPSSAPHQIGISMICLFNLAQQSVEKHSEYWSNLDSCVRLLQWILEMRPKTYLEKQLWQSSIMTLDNMTSEDRVIIDDSIREIVTARVPLPMDYLRANLRLIECLKTDCYLSRKVSDRISRTLFS